MAAKRSDFAHAVPLESSEQEVQRKAILAEQWREVDQNEGLVCYFAERYRVPARGILHVEDLKSAGRLGALRAVQRRDPALPQYQWKRYLAFWVRRSVQEALSSQAVPIKLPPIANRKHMERFRPDQPAWAAVRDLLDHPVVSAGWERDAPRDPNPEPVEDLMEREDRLAVRAAVAELPRPEREVIESSFGIDREPCSDRALANRNGVSPWRIQNQKRQALGRLRRVLAWRG